MLDDPAAAPVAKGRLVHALGEASTAAGRDLLLAHLVHGDPVVVEAAGLALAAAGRGLLSADEVPLHDALVQQAERANRCLAVLSTLDDRPALEPLVGALRDGRRWSAPRSGAREPGPRPAGRACRPRRPRPRGHRERSAALEMLEVSLGRSVSALVLALVDPTLDDDVRRRALDTWAQVVDADRGTWLRHLVVDDDDTWHDSWLGLCPLRPAVVPSRRGRRARGAVARRP